MQLCQPIAIAGSAERWRYNLSGKAAVAGELLPWRRSALRYWTN